MVFVNFSENSSESRQVFFIRFKPYKESDNTALEESSISEGSQVDADTNLLLLFYVFFFDHNLNPRIVQEFTCTGSDRRISVETLLNERFYQVSILIVAIKRLKIESLIQNSIVHV